MKVLMVPEFKGNPYQRLLKEALEKEEVEVTMADSDNPSLLFKKVKEVRPDVLHVHWVHPMVLGRNWFTSFLKVLTGGSALRTIRRRGTAIVWTVHNITDHEKRFPRWDRYIRRRLVRLSNRMIVHSNSALKEVEEAYGVSDKVAVIRHGNYIGGYPDAVSRNDARKELDISASTRVILFFGYVRPYKGLEELIRSFKEIKGDAVLLIAGKPDGENTKAELERLIGKDERIKLHLGYVPDDKVQVFMGAADVVALPFREILTSGSAVLAMSFGRTVIAPRIGPMEELFDDDMAFLYGEDGPKGPMERAISISAQELREMGDQCRIRARSNDWDSVARSTAAIYQDAVDVGR